MLKFGPSLSSKSNLKLDFLVFDSSISEANSELESIAGVSRMQASPSCCCFTPAARPGSLLSRLRPGSSCCRIALPTPAVAAMLRSGLGRCCAAAQTGPGPGLCHAAARPGSPCCGPTRVAAVLLRLPSLAARVIHDQCRAAVLPESLPCCGPARPGVAAVLRLGPSWQSRSAAVLRHGPLSCCGPARVRPCRVVTRPRSLTCQVTAQPSYCGWVRLWPKPSPTAMLRPGAAALVAAAAYCRSAPARPQAGPGPAGESLPCRGRFAARPAGPGSCRVATT
jgi:hypothetical protein